MKYQNKANGLMVWKYCDTVIANSTDCLNTTQHNATQHNWLSKHTCKKHISNAIRYFIPRLLSALFKQAKPNVI